MTTSLLRAEAEARKAVVSQVSYEIDLDLLAAAESDRFASVTTVRFAARPGTATFLQLQPATLRSVNLNGAGLDLDEVWNAGSGRIALAGLREHNVVVVIAAMAYSHDGEGVHKHVDPADGNTYLYATSALAAAPRWFACFDQPDIKAEITLTVAAPADWTVLGNGAVTETAPGRCSFAPTRPMSTYVATVVAGPYHSVRGSHDGIPLGLHVRASLAEALDRDAEELLCFTGACLDEFHRMFGVRYPWGEYHQVFCPDFNWGAMENPGCVTFRDGMIFRGPSTTAERTSRAGTIAHEMAHMWFGNLVTFAWWDDLWLNESFAEYLGHRVAQAVSDYDAWTEFGAVRKAWGYAADRRPTTHPIAGNGIDDVANALDAFDGISYAKGAAALKQLVAHLGDEVFLRGLRAYFAAHEYGNATFADLIAAWTGAGASGLDEWAAAWLRTSGVDTLALACGALVREGSRPHAVTVAAYDAGGAELGRARLRVSGPMTAVAGMPADAALLLPDAEDETWAKLALPQGTWEQLPSFVAELPAPARVGVSNALRLAVADAELDPVIAADVVEALLRTEPDEAVITSVGTWALDSLAARYLPAGPVRDGGCGRIAASARALLAAADPGSGRQLAAARLFVGATDDLAEVRAWLGGDAPEGLELDPDLRWVLLGKLVAHDQAGPSEIEALAAEDPSAQGADHAARLRALAPTPEAKSAAWHMLIFDRVASNYELYATAAGFWHPAQTELTAPYVGRYFAEINSTVAIRGDWVVKRLASHAYPWTHVEQNTLELAASLLRTDDLAEALRNPILDATDDLRRAVESRARFT